MSRDELRRAAALEQMLCEHIWNQMGSLHLGSETFEVVGCDEVPGYDEHAMLLRRPSDGGLFQASIIVTITAVAARPGGEPR